MDNIIAPQSSSPATPPTTNKKPALYQALVILTNAEFIFYLIMYVLAFFAGPAQYVPGTYFISFNFPLLAIALLGNFFARIVWALLIVKALLIIKNFVSKQFVRTTLLSALVSLCNAYVASAAVIFVLTVINIFILQKPGVETFSQLQQINYIFPVLLILFYLTFWHSHKLDKMAETASSTTGKRDWIIAIILTAVLAGLVWGANIGLSSIRTKAVHQEATQGSLNLLGANGEKLTQVKIDVSNISGNGFTINLNWNNSAPALQPGIRLYVLYSDNFVMSGKNAYGGEYSDQERGVCVVTKQSDGSLSCSVNYSSAALKWQDKNNYQFFTDFSTAKPTDTINQSMTPEGIKARNQKRTADLMALQKAFGLYFNKNGFYPCTKDFIGAKDYISNGFDCNNIPAFDYTLYKDPLPKKQYYIFTNKNQIFNSGQESFMAYAELEPEQNSFSKSYFCVDSKEAAATLPTFPNLNHKIDCSNY